MPTKNTLTGEDIKTLEYALKWFMNAAVYCDDFKVQKVLGYSDDHWKMDDALFKFEMLVDKFTGGHQKKMQNALEKFDKRYNKNEVENAK
mgnify:CR=1 FL=1